MTKEEYRKMRINQLGADYTKHNTSKPGWDKCIALECGDWPEFRRETSEKVTLEMLLKCEYSPAEIVAVLKEGFPDKDNNGRPKRIFSIFSKGKCRNITEYCNGKILGLKWDKYKFFAKDSNELKTISCLDYETNFEVSVEKSKNDTSEARKARLRESSVVPESFEFRASDFFDKRFAIYKGTQVLLSKILKEGKCDLEMLDEFRGATQDAIFLFDDGIPAYLKEIENMFLHIWRFQEDLKGIRRSKKRTELCGVNMELFTILTEELPNLKNVFAPYIKFDKRK